MSNYRGYYIKINGNTFQNPAPKRDGLLIMPHLVQTADSGVLASGKLSIKVLKHTRTKIQIQFPIMTPAQFKTYYSILHRSMYLNVEYYNDGIDAYETGTFYHNDIQYKPIIWNGKMMIDMQEVHLIEH